MIEIFYVWSEKFENFVNKILSSNDDMELIVIDHLHDIITKEFCESDSLLKLYDYCTNKNIPIILLSAQRLDSMNLPPNIKILIWQTFWFHRTYKAWIVDSKQTFNKEVKKIDITDHNTNSCENLVYPYICLNNRIKNHRCLIMDLLCQNNILDKGVVSWLEGSENQNSYVYKYWKPKKMVLDQEIITLQETLPLQFNSSFLQLVTESDDTYQFISEKTATPLLLNKPFIIAGAVNCHRDLQNLGFELYTELFDYSFDNEPDIEKRYEAIIKNVKRYIDMNPNGLNTLYRSVSSKVTHNRRLAYRYSTCAPKEILDLVNLLIEKNVDIRWSLNNLNLLNCL